MSDTTHDQNATGQVEPAAAPAKPDEFRTVAADPRPAVPASASARLTWSSNGKPSTTRPRQAIWTYVKILVPFLPRCSRLVMSLPTMEQPTPSAP